MLQIASYTDIGGRSCNEDTVRHVLREGDRLCLVVADGLGGHGGGDQASSAAAEVICRDWDGTAAPETLTALIRSANQQVLSLQTSQCDMMTTIVALTLTPERAVWAHAGDSRLYYFHNGKLIFQTMDHSASQIAVMLGQITPDQIRFHEDRSRILRALGQGAQLTVDTGTQDLGPGQHAFLLCSDGFWEYVLEPEMETDLKAAQTPQQWLERMRRRLQKRVLSDHDNNTAAAVWLEAQSKQQ